MKNTLQLTPCHCCAAFTCVYKNEAIHANYSRQYKHHMCHDADEGEEQRSDRADERSVY